MANNTYRTRVQLKNDTAENWAKAVNFVPLKGEAIIYSDKNKIKIGDGVTKVNDLDFINKDIDLTDYITESELNEKGYLTYANLEEDESGIFSDYVTEAELEAKGYLTEHQDLSEYVKNNAMNKAITEATSNMLTYTDIEDTENGVFSDYITESELEAKGYLTSIPDTYALKSDIKSNLFAVNATNVTSEAPGYSGTVDKSVTEIVAAIQEGKKVTAFVPNMGSIDVISNYSDQVDGYFYWDGIIFNYTQKNNEFSLKPVSSSNTFVTKYTPTIEEDGTISYTTDHSFKEQYAAYSAGKSLIALYKTTQILYLDVISSNIIWYKSLSSYYNIKHYLISGIEPIQYVTRQNSFDNLYDSTDLDNSFLVLNKDNNFKFRTIAEKLIQIYKLGDLSAEQIDIDFSSLTFPIVLMNSSNQAKNIIIIDNNGDIYRLAHNNSIPSSLEKVNNSSSVDLSEYAKTSDIPTKLSQLENDNTVLIATYQLQSDDSMACDKTFDEIHTALKSGYTVIARLATNVYRILGLNDYGDDYINWYGAWLNNRGTDTSLGNIAEYDISHTSEGITYSIYFNDYAKQSYLDNRYATQEWVNQQGFKTTDNDTTYTAGTGINISDTYEISVDTSVLSSGSGDSVDEVYIGSTTPTDGQEIWIDTSDDTDAEGDETEYVTTSDLTNYALKTELFSGSYNDLTDKPTLFSGSYTDLTNKPTTVAISTSISAASTDSNAVTPKAVYNYVQTAITSLPTVYTGDTTPDSTIGSNGDLYLIVEG